MNERGMPLEPVDAEKERGEFGCQEGVQGKVNRQQDKRGAL
jgi:hypothetical protein